MKTVDKIKHWWYTYVINQPEKSPFYHKKYEVVRRALKRVDLIPNKIYHMPDDIFFSVAIDVICGDASFVMTRGEKTPNDVTKSYMIDVHDFLHIQCDGTDYRQCIWFVPYKYFKESENGLSKFDGDMMSDIFNYLITKVNEIKQND